MIDHCSTPVVDQDNTGTCWAHGIVAMVETELFEEDGCEGDFRLSERAVACGIGRDLMDGDPDNDGATLAEIGASLNKQTSCGTSDLVADSCVTGVGLAGPCPSNAQLNNCNDKFRITGWDTVAATDSAVNSALQSGPVLFAMTWDPGDWDDTTGEWTGGNGGVGSGVHAVTVTGYNEETGMYTLKNSWGAGAGDAGYFYLPADQIANVGWQGFSIQDVEQC